MTKWLLMILAAVIIFFGFVLRINRFSDYPSYQWQAQDYSRDYIAAHHITHYGERPLTGPDGKLGTTKSSPLYFYFLASLLIINDSPVFLAYTNVFLQLFALILLYLLTRELFGMQTGLMAVMLFAVSENIIEQSASLWQPYVMQPFLLLSCLLLWRSYHNKNYPLLLFSIAMFSFSSTLHLSVLGLMPAYAAIIIHVAKRQQITLVRSAGVIATFFGSFLLLYLPPILYAWNIPVSHNEFLSPVTGIFFHQSSGMLLNSMLLRSRGFFEFFFTGLPDWRPSLPLAAGILIIAAIIYFKKTRRPKKSYTAVLIIAIVQFFFIVLFLDPDAAKDFPVHYFTPVFSLFIILLAELINIVPIKNIKAKSGKIAMVVILIWMVSPNLFQKINNARSRLQEKGIINFFAVPHDTDPLINAVANKIQNIRLTEKRTGFKFFQIAPYRIGYLDNDYLYMGLEHALHAKLVELDDAAWRDYRPLGADDYIFVACSSLQNSMEYDYADCAARFLTSHPDHLWIQTVYSGYPYSIYLAQKKL